MSPRSWSPDPEVPVFVVGHLDGHWSRTPDGPSVAVRGEWVRVGNQVRAWTDRVVISLPAGSRPPDSYGLLARGYLRRPAPLANGGAVSRSGWRLYAKSEHFIRAIPSSGFMPWAHRLSARLRARIRASLEGPEIVGSPGAYLIQALILGEGWALPTSWRRGLQASGLSHLIALSGLHIGLLAGMILGLTFRLPLRARTVLIMVLVIGYLNFVGPRPALIRACFMLIGIWLCLWLQRSPLPGNTLVAIAAGMMVVDPRLIDDLGFRLTVSATAGILVLSPILERRWTWLPGWLSRPMSVSVGAQLGTLPWAIPEFHLLTPLSPIWNLVAVPWTALALGVGAIWSCIAITSKSLAAVAAPWVNAVALPFAGVASLPPSVTRPIIVDWSHLEASVVTLLFFGALAGRRLWPLAAGLVLLLLGSNGSSRDESAELVLLDVGQGESILLRHGEAAVLLDGGGWRRGDIGSRILLPALAGLGVTQLNALVLSHPDLDHCGGLVQAASFFPIDEVWSSPGWGPVGCVADLHTLPGVAIRPLWEGQERRVGGWHLQVLNPQPGVRRGVNDRSLVLLATFNDRRFLLTGDIEAAAERRLLKAHPEALRDVDVLKIAHHGSRTSSTAEWLDHIQPSLALVSAGVDNRYGHPSPLVMKRLAVRGIPSLRTDLQGLVRVRVERAGVLQIRLPGSPKARTILESTSGSPR